MDCGLSDLVRLRWLPAHEAKRHGSLQRVLQPRPQPCTPFHMDMRSF